MLVKQTSTRTLAGENEVIGTTASEFTLSIYMQKQNIALKVNRLKDKSIRYESHRFFEPLFS